jgi:hypothetical protein
VARVDTAGVLPLFEAIAAELERLRPVTAQVVQHLVGTHSVARENIGAFLTEELLQLEDYEVELVLAPLFTPTLDDQAVVAELLGKESLAASEWPGLVQQLVSRPTRAHLRTEDGVTHLVPLREVTVERFVYRLRLDGTIGDGLFKLIGSLPQAGDRALLKAVARRTIWENPGRAVILSRYLESVGDAFRTDDAAALLKLVETYGPANVTELVAKIPHWQQILRQEINDSGTKPFFNERVEELHGGGRDQRRQDNNRVAAKEREQAFLERLQRVLAD